MSIPNIGRQVATITQLSGELLDAVTAELEAEYPEARVVEAAFDVRRGARSDHGPRSTWAKIDFRVQVDNDTGHGESIVDALEALLADRARKVARVPVAERVAAILREVPRQGFEREKVLDEVRVLLEQR